jgi:hypothetical protein
MLCYTTPLLIRKQSEHLTKSHSPSHFVGLQWKVTDIEFQLFDILLNFWPPRLICIQRVWYISYQAETYPC